MNEKKKGPRPNLDAERRATWRRAYTRHHGVPMTKDIGILIRDLPNETNRTLSTLATLRGKRKWEIIREALIEYADRHRLDIVKFVKEKS